MQTEDLTKGKLPIFVALAYGLTWLFWIPAALSGRDVNTTTWILPYLLGGFGPSVAGIVMVYWGQDEEERRSFWRRLVDFKRISAGWYAFMVLVFPLLFAASFLLNGLLDNPPPRLETLARGAANPLLLVGMMVTGILTGPLSEELGWRGFALDQLQARGSPLVSSLILALLWWGWHLPLFFMKGTTQSAWGVGELAFWLFAIGSVPLSILLTWVYNHNDRSILAAVLLHFTYNSSFGLVYPLSETVHLLQVILLSMTAFGMVLVAPYKDR